MEEEKIFGEAEVIAVDVAKGELVSPKVFDKWVYCRCCLYFFQSCMVYQYNLVTKITKLILTTITNHPKNSPIKGLDQRDIINLYDNNHKKSLIIWDWAPSCLTVLFERYLCIGSEIKGYVVIIDIESNFRVIKFISTGGHTIKSIHVHHHNDGPRLIICKHIDPPILVLRWPNLEKVVYLSVRFRNKATSIRSLSISRDQRFLAVLGYMCGLLLYRLDTGGWNKQSYKQKLVNNPNFSLNKGYELIARNLNHTELTLAFSHVHSNQLAIAPSDIVGSCNIYEIVEDYDSTTELSERGGIEVFEDIGGDKNAVSMRSVSEIKAIEGYEIRMLAISSLVKYSSYVDKHTGQDKSILLWIEESRNVHVVDIIDNKHQIIKLPIPEEYIILNTWSIVGADFSKDGRELYVAVVQEVNLKQETVVYKYRLNGEQGMYSLRDLCIKTIQRNIKSFWNVNLRDSLPEEVVEEIWGPFRSKNNVDDAEEVTKMRKEGEKEVGEALKGKMQKRRRFHRDRRNRKVWREHDQNVQIENTQHKCNNCNKVLEGDHFSTSLLFSSPWNRMCVECYVDIGKEKRAGKKKRSEVKTEFGMQYWKTPLLELDDEEEQEEKREEIEKNKARIMSDYEGLSFTSRFRKKWSRRI